MVDGIIFGGMILKVEICIDVLECGVKGVVIFNGKVFYLVLFELFIDGGVGMLIKF